MTWIDDYFDRLENHQFGLVYYRLWMRERANPKNIMQYVSSEMFVMSIEEGALRSMQAASDAEWECYKVDLVEIYAN